MVDFKQFGEVRKLVGINNIHLFYFFFWKVSLTKKLHEIGGIDGVLEEVRSVINEGMDVVDMAEEYLDKPDAHQ